MVPHIEKGRGLHLRNANTDKHRELFFTGFEALPRGLSLRLSLLGNVILKSGEYDHFLVGGQVMEALAAPQAVIHWLAP
jgi:hypothetical protein